ncbi:MAG TPA: transglycosylase SLT domain-containing protein [Bryobacteraceae bacterium]
MANPQPPAGAPNPAPPTTPDTSWLPAGSNYIFVAAPVTPAQLKTLIDSIESDADDNPVNDEYPTNQWVYHVYSAIQTDPATNVDTKGYVVLYGAPPSGGGPAAQVAPVTGVDDAAKAAAAALAVGRGNELIGYEDFAGPARVVIFRVSTATVPPVGTPTSLSWNMSDHPERQDWTTKLLSLVTQGKAKLDQGNPNSFISGYNGLAAPMQIKFWAEMLVAIARFESSWKSTDVFRESFGVNSVGLLQLSYQDQANYHLTPTIPDENGLKDPILNLTWGVAIFSYWLAKDGVVASGSGSSSRGSARYWSTMRTGTGHYVEMIKTLTKQNVGL